MTTTTAPPGANVKVCRLCGSPKELAEFYRKTQNRDGRTHECRDCIKSRTREWKRQHPERHAAQQRRRRERQLTELADLRAKVAMIEGNRPHRFEVVR